MTAINIVPFDQEYYYYDFLITYYASDYNTNKTVPCAFTIMQCSRTAPDDDLWAPQALTRSVMKWLHGLEMLNKNNKAGNYSTRFNIYDTCLSGGKDYDWFSDDVYVEWFNNAGDYPCLFSPVEAIG